jgi:type IV pilus assembly protein PilP
VRGLLLIVAAMVVVAVACGSPEPTGGGGAAAPKTGTAPKAAAKVDAGTPDIVATVPYLYNPVGKRDPFRSLIDEVRSATGGIEQGSLCNEPLCGFDLDQLTLVAVVSGDANPIAMVEDPAKVGHLVHRNSRVGKQGGKVTAIQRDCVVVTEYFQTPDGKVSPNRVNLCIKNDKRSQPVLDLLQNKIFETQ